MLAEAMKVSTFGGAVFTWISENAGVIGLGFTATSAIGWIYFTKLGHDLKKREDKRREEEHTMNMREREYRLNQPG